MKTYVIAAAAVCTVIVIAVIYKRAKGAKAPPQLMTREETAQFLMADADGYIAGLSAADLYARRARTSAEYAHRAAAAAVDLDDYKHKIEAAAQLAGGISAKIAGTSGRHYEDGLPHTRADVIFITPEIAGGTLEKLAETLRHEAIHIYQRQNPAEMADRMREAGYVRVAQRKDYPLARANPDLDEWIYADANGKIYIAEYTSAKPSSIRDVRLSDPAYEHPYEKMAYTA